MANKSEIDDDLISVNRYLSAVAVCNSLALLLSQGPPDIYVQRLSLLKQIRKLWSKGNDIELAVSGNWETDSGDELILENELKSETDDPTLQSAEMNEDDYPVLANNCLLQSIKEELQEKILEVVHIVNKEKKVRDKLPLNTTSEPQHVSSVKSRLRKRERKTKNSLTAPSVVSAEVESNGSAQPEFAESVNPTIDGSNSGEDSKELNFICTDCNLNLKTYADLEIHRLQEHASSFDGSRPIHSTDMIDPGADASSSKAVSLRAKYKRARDQREHACHVCGKKFWLRCELKKHVKIHTGEKPFMCSVCGKCFRTRSMLNEHTRIHLDDRRHSCYECGKSFIQSSGLKDHFIAVHSKVRAHVCNVCGQDFFRITLLNYHMRSHTGEKPYCCSVCGKKFALSRQLRSHIIIHGDDYPFQCETCSKKFKSKGGLNRHKRLHMEVKPFGCTFCPRTFTQGSNLRVHMRTHTGEKPYKCSDCGQKFSHQPTLKKHQETVHKS